MPPSRFRTETNECPVEILESHPLLSGNSETNATLTRLEDQPDVRLGCAEVDTH